MAISGELLDRLASLGSTICLDALRVLGVHRVFLEGVSCLVPGQRLAGVAVTLRMLPERPDFNADIAPLRDKSAEYVAMEKCDDRSVLVIDAMGWRHDSVGGDIKFSRLAHQRARGLVTDGGVRDLDTLREYGLSVFAATQTAKAGPLSFQPAEEGRLIQCGGVLVRPGDVLVGDDAGVVVIPSALVEQVIRIATERLELEAWIKEQLKLHPQSPGRFYPINEDVKREFEAWKQRKQPPT
jgi:regulator of RNase E activity RraA